MKIKLAETKEELDQILVLQEKNHFDNVSIKNRSSQGFLRIRHTLEQLQTMNQEAFQIIATENNKVVGYALVMLKSSSEKIPLLIPMFQLFNKLEYNQRKLTDYNYYVMGQICVEETERGKGVFEKLYLKHKERYFQTFDICLTEVSSSNFRSMKAHQKIGFKTIHSFSDDTDHWNILLWDWR